MLGRRDSSGSGRAAESTPVDTGEIPVAKAVVVEDPQFVPYASVTEAHHYPDMAATVATVDATALSAREQESLRRRKVASVVVTIAVCAVVFFIVMRFYFFGVFSGDKDKKPTSSPTRLASTCEHKGVACESSMEIFPSRVMFKTDVPRSFVYYAEVPFSDFQPLKYSIGSPYCEDICVDPENPERQVMYAVLPFPVERRRWELQLRIAQEAASDLETVKYLQRDIVPVNVDIREGPRCRTVPVYCKAWPEFYSSNDVSFAAPENEQFYLFMHYLVTNVTESAVNTTSKSVYVKLKVL